MTAIRQLFPRVIDSSMLSSFRKCRHKFFREYIQHWKHPGKNIHLHAGGAYAHALEAARIAYYVEGTSIPEAEMRGAEALREFWGDFIPDFDTPKTLERMLGALDFYFANYPMDTDSAVPAELPGGKKGIEFSFAEPLPINHPTSGEPLIFAGRADMIVDLAGALYLEDDKTTSSLGASWAKNWEMRGQFSGYCWAAQAIGMPVAGVLIRGVSILKTKYDTQQVLSYRADHEIARWYDQSLRDIEAMIRCWNEGYWDFDLDDGCASYGGCGFMQPCKSPDPDSWITPVYEQRVWDPISRQELTIDEYEATWK